jgi:heme exporter protein C
MLQSGARIDYMENMMQTAQTGGAVPPAGRSLHRFANPGRFLRIAQTVQPWLTVPAISLTVIGLTWGLFFAPADWQQGDAVRIMYVHVPSAWLASSGYLGLAICSLLSLVWRHPLADLAAVEIGPVGAGFTALCLATGSLWGRPMWGAWWVWDARLTSVLILLFLYLGHIVLVRAFDDPVRGYRSAAVLGLIGVIMLPIIKFSVEDWWLRHLASTLGPTLHQKASITLTGSSMDASMLWPLLISAVGFTLAFASIVVARLRAAVMERRIRGLLMARAGSG